MTPAGNPAKKTHLGPDLIPLGPGSGSTVMGPAQPRVAQIGLDKSINIA